MYILNFKAHILDNGHLGIWFLKYSLSIGRCNQHHGWWCARFCRQSHSIAQRTVPLLYQAPVQSLGRNKLFLWYKTKSEDIWMVPCLMFRLPLYLISCFFFVHGNRSTWDIISLLSLFSLWNLWYIWRFYRQIENDVASVSHDAYSLVHCYIFFLEC